MTLIAISEFSQFFAHLFSTLKRMNSEYFHFQVLGYCPKDMKADICVHLNRKVGCWTLNN